MPRTMSDAGNAPCIMQGCRWLLPFQQKLARDKSFYGSAETLQQAQPLIWLIWSGGGPDDDVDDATEGRNVLNVMTTAGTRLTCPAGWLATVVSSIGSGFDRLHLASPNQSPSPSPSPGPGAGAGFGFRFWLSDTAGGGSRSRINLCGSLWTWANCRCSYRDFWTILRGFREIYSWIT